MGIDYSIEVYRKKDNKKIAEFICNQFKNISYNGFVEESDFNKFEINDLTLLKESILSKKNKISEKISKIENMIPKSKNREIKSAFEEDIRYLEEELSELECAYCSVNMIIGMIDVVVEDNIDMKTEECAYKYNAKDMKKSKDDCPTIWVDDVYFKLVSNY